MSDTRGVELTKGDTNIKADDVEEAREGEERCAIRYTPHGEGTARRKSRWEVT